MFEYLYYKLWKLSSVNYGNEGGSQAAWVQISILISMNVVSLLGLLGKLVFRIHTLSLILMFSIFSITLTINYIYLFHNSKYKNIRAKFEANKSQNMSQIVFVISYILLTIGVFVMSVLI